MVIKRLYGLCILEIHSLHQQPLAPQQLNSEYGCIVYHDDIFRDSVSTQYDNQRAFLIAQKLVSPKFYTRNERRLST